MISLISALFAMCSMQYNPYQDPSIPPAKRAQDLVSRMTVEEKIAQCMMDAPAISRLGVPAYHYWNEALHGVARNGVATVFPQAIGLAATWDTNLMHEVATTISVEARAKYKAAQEAGEHGIYKGLTLWSPNVNIFRDPRWGRGHETYGEDPFLTGRMGVAFVTGIQGDDPKYLRASATAKHFAVHSGPEPLRHGFDAKVTDQELHDFYLSAFEACVREGHVSSVMSAYSGFNSVPATGNPWLLTKLLREDWGFDGAVVSDVDSVGDLWGGHHVAKDRAEASAMAIKAGNDECSGTTYEGLKEALDRKLIQVADIDRAATRLFTLRFRLGMFDGPDQCAFNRIPVTDNDTPAHEQVALQAAEKSLVLLKNEEILPLKTETLKRVAVIGPVAESHTVLEGNYNGTPARPVTLLAGLRAVLETKGIRVDHLAGSPLVAGPGAREPFPDGVCFTDESRTTPGLKGEVFNGIRFEGPALSTRIDLDINLEWYDSTIIAGIPKNNTSIRWTGVMVWPKDEKVDLKVSADDGSRLYIDDKLVIDEWRDQAEASYSIPFTFEEGRAYRIKLEYYQAGGGAAIRFGRSHRYDSSYDFAPAVELAKVSDLVILTLGITPDLEGEEMNVTADGFKGGDRTSLDLPEPQRDLLHHIAATGKPVVVVLTGGSAISFNTDEAHAILLQWYSGEKGGEAVANTLLGKANPAGRLPVTFYKSVSDLPPFEDYHLAGRTYRYFHGRPLFPFGYGLSYSHFAYGEPTLASSSVTAAGSIQLTVPITNSGAMDGDEVVQVYLRENQPQPGSPIRRLIAFRREAIAAGATKSIKLDFPVERLRSWDTAEGGFRVRPGGYTLEIGASSQDVRRKVEIRVG